MSNQSVNCDSLEEKAGKLSSAAEPLTKNSLSDDYKDTTLTAYSNSLSSFEKSQDLIYSLNKAMCDKAEIISNFGDDLREINENAKTAAQGLI